MSTPSPTPPTTPGTGNSGGRQPGRGGGRNRNRNRGGRGGRAQAAAPRRSNFKGSIKEMEGKVFETHEERIGAEQFEETLEKLIEYVSSKFNARGEGKTDILQMLRSFEEVTIAEPAVKEATTINAVYNHRWVEHEKKKDGYQAGKTALFPVIWGQCSIKMRAKKVEAYPGFDKVKEENKTLDLLKIIQVISYRFETHRQAQQTYIASLGDLLACKQLPTQQSVTQYYKSIKSHFEAMSHYGDGFFEVPTIRAMMMVSNTVDLETAKTKIKTRLYTQDAVAEANKKAGETMKAAIFIRQADPRRFGALQAELANDYSKAQAKKTPDPYPQTLEEARILLENHVMAPQIQPSRAHEEPEHQLAFAQVARGAANTEFPDIQCYRCQQWGHYADGCTNESVPRGGTPATESTQETMNALVSDDDSDTTVCCAVTDTRDYLIDPNWILLDSASTVNMFSNPNFLSNIRKSDKPEGCTVHSNGGATIVNQVGELPGFGTVWLNENGIGNVLSMAAMAELYRVTQDTDEYEGVKVHRPGLAPLHFLPSRRGLYYYDATPMALSTTKHSVNAYSYNFVTTMARNLEMFTRRQRQKIADAKRLYELLD